MRASVITFPGSNCDYDAYHVLRHILNIPVDFVWHKKTDLKKYDVILIPGGFSYGDYLRTGAIARFSPIMHAVINEAKRGKHIFGICNGFQILIECGLLPGSLIVNKNVLFLSQDIRLQAINTQSRFTHLLKKGQELIMPIAHKQGNFIADSDTLKMLQDEDRIAFRYYRGNKGNPNGSMDCIAGILNQTKNVLGMMPHPERASESILGSPDGLFIFKSILGVS